MEDMKAADDPSPNPIHPKKRSKTNICFPQEIGHQFSGAKMLVSGKISTKGFDQGF